MVTKSSADSISVLPVESGRLADAIASVGPPVLKLKLSALAGAATNPIDIAETNKATAMIGALGLIARACLQLGGARPGTEQNQRRNTVL